tara:strand:- start:570 stop:1004 length:435 start_codon:yes stop_codon:yes gene_type:complete
MELLSDKYIPQLSGMINKLEELLEEGSATVEKASLRLAEVKARASNLDVSTDPEIIRELMEQSITSVREVNEAANELRGARLDVVKILEKVADRITCNRMIPDLIKRHDLDLIDQRIVELINSADACREISLDVKLQDGQIEMV